MSPEQNPFTPLHYGEIHSIQRCEIFTEYRLTLDASGKLFIDVRPIVQKAVKSC